MTVTSTVKKSAVSYDPFRAVYFGGRELLKLTGITYKHIWLLLRGDVSVKASVSGPIGIAHFIGQAAHSGVVPLLGLMAYISMALAIFNLLPFPGRYSSLVKTRQGITYRLG